jgi:hypothetical protein
MHDYVTSFCAQQRQAFFKSVHSIAVDIYGCGALMPTSNGSEKLCQPVNQDFRDTFNE